MKLTIFEDSPRPRNEWCWRCIRQAVEDWEPEIKGVFMEARFLPDQDLLEFTMAAPGRARQTATIDITWIAYADQADYLALSTVMALRDMESGMLAEGEQASAAA